MDPDPLIEWAAERRRPRSTAVVDGDNLSPIDRAGVQRVQSEVQPQLVGVVRRGCSLRRAIRTLQVAQRGAAGPPLEARHLVFGLDGTRIATASDDHTAKVRDAATGRGLLTLRDHGHAVSSVAWSPDGTRVATSSLDATVRLWDASSGALLRTLARG